MAPPGEAAAPPERSHAISALFLPPEASRRWIDLPPDKRRLGGVRIMQSATPEEEAQSIALLVREAMETPQKRVVVVTPDRPLARRIVAHLARWGIAADDTAGRPLSQTAAGRLLLLVAEVAAGGVAPVALMALLTHPLANAQIDRRDWLAHTRTLERALRVPRPRDGLEPLARIVAAKAQATPGAGGMVGAGGGDFGATASRCRRGHRWRTRWKRWSPPVKRWAARACGRARMAGRWRGSWKSSPGPRARLQRRSTLVKST